MSRWWTARDAIAWARCVARSFILAGLVVSPAATFAQECGDPTGDGHTTAPDALEVLRAALELGECEPCVCDVDGSGDVVTVDALTLLAVATGASADLDCPACPTTTTVEPPKVACGDPQAGAPACDGYCGVNGQMCVESPPGSGACQCIFGPTCGAAGGPPVCAGGCHALWICTDVGGTCRCVF